MDALDNLIFSYMEKIKMTKIENNNNKEKELAMVIKKKGKIFNEIDEKICIVLFVCMVVLVCLEIVMRYLLNSPLVWTEELDMFLFIWLVFIGAIVVTRRNLHIRLIEPWSNFNKIIIDILIIIFLFTIFFGFISLERDLYNTRTPALRIPITWIIIAIPMGAVVMIFYYGQDLIFKILRRRK